MMLWGVPPAVARGPLWEKSADPKADRRLGLLRYLGTAADRDVECFANRLFFSHCAAGLRAVSHFFHAEIAIPLRPMKDPSTQQAMTLPMKTKVSNTLKAQVEK